MIELAGQGDDDEIETEAAPKGRLHGHEQAQHVTLLGRVLCRQEG
jgi:hypothetical protein